MYINKTSELENFCKNLPRNNFITIDTEFSRETTYYPKLCLIQIASNNAAVIIDALSPDIDLSILDNVLQDPQIVKVFHSAKQDLEILYNIYGHLPINIFDTQIAASFCGYNCSVSYETLVLDVISKQIDKSHRISDWTKRPLTEKQIEYALGDVTYLQKIYVYLTQKLEEDKRLDWAIEEMQILGNPNNFIVDINEVWQKIKLSREIKVTLVLKKLAAWRELKAQAANLPRNHYLNERYLIKLSNTLPITSEELKRISYFQNIEESLAEEITQVIQSALAQQIEEDLKQDNFLSIKNDYSKTLSQLKSLLEEKAKKYNIPPQLIATSSELKSFASKNSSTKQAKFLNGWRYKVFGESAIDIQSNN